MSSFIRGNRPQAAVSDRPHLRQALDRSLSVEGRLRSLSGRLDDPHGGWQMVEPLPLRAATCRDVLEAPPNLDTPS